MTDQTIEKLTIDEVDYAVAELPEEIQGAVTKYEEWRERQLVATDEVQLVSAALRDLGAQIVAAIRVNEEQQAAAAAEAEEMAAAEAEAAATAAVVNLPETPEDDGDELLVVED